MLKQILSEIDLYAGEPKTPKGFEIDRTSIKNDIINEYLAENSVNKIFTVFRKIEQLYT